jgi:hypothetical protein
VQYVFSLIKHYIVGKIHVLKKGKKYIGEGKPAV